MIILAMSCLVWQGEEISNVSAAGKFKKGRAGGMRVLKDS